MLAHIQRAVDSASTAIPEPAQLRSPRRAPVLAAVSAGVLARGRRGNQLPPLLRHQRAGRAADGGSAGIRTHARVCLRAPARRIHRRLSHRPRRRALRSGDYLERLQARAREVRPDLYTGIGGCTRRRKILGLDEWLPSWPVEGTTGYEFLIAVNGLFVDGRHEARGQRGVRALHAAARAISRVRVTAASS